MEHTGLLEDVRGYMFECAYMKFVLLVYVCLCMCVCMLALEEWTKMLALEEWTKRATLEEYTHTHTHVTCLV